MCDNLIILRVLRENLNKIKKFTEQSFEVKDKIEKIEQYEFDCLICGDQFKCKKEIKFSIFCLDCTMSSYMKGIILDENKLIKKTIEENPFKTLEELKNELTDNLQKNNKLMIDQLKQILIGWLDNNVTPYDIMLTQEQHDELSSTIDGIKKKCGDNIYDNSFCSVLYEKNIKDCMNKLVNQFIEKLNIKIHQRVSFEIFTQQLARLEKYIKLNGIKNISEILLTNDFDAILPHFKDIKIDESILEKIEKTLLISYDALEGTRVGISEPSVMRQNFETSVLRCPRCQRGPTFFAGCADLWAHHALPINKFNDPSLHTDGRCSSCYFYGYLKSDWISFGSNEDKMEILPVVDGGLWEPLKCENKTNCYNINDNNWEDKKGTVPPRYPCYPWSGGSETNSEEECDSNDNLQNRIQTKSDLITFLLHKATSEKRFNPKTLGSKSWGGSFLSPRNQQLFNKALSNSQALVNEVSRDDIISSFERIKWRYGLPDWPNEFHNSGATLAEVISDISHPFKGDINVEILSYSADSQVEVRLYQKNKENLQIGKEAGSVNLNIFNTANMIHTFTNFESSSAFIKFTPGVKEIQIYGYPFNFGMEEFIKYSKDSEGVYEFRCEKKYRYFVIQLVLN